MTTKEAFTQLINTDNWHEKAGINYNTARTLKKRFLDGKLISLEKMEEILEKAGYKVVQEKKWTT